MHYNHIVRLITPSSTTPSIRPFVKWAGGKTQLLGTLDKYIPDDFSNYIEPIVGRGGFILSFDKQKKKQTF